jgi:hypothetical protein
MNTKRVNKFKLRRMKRAFERSPRLQKQVGAFKDLVHQAHDTFHALRNKMDRDGDSPLWATRRRYLRRGNQAHRALKKAVRARELRTTAENARRKA